MIEFKIKGDQKGLTTTPIGPLPGGFRLQVGYGRDVQIQDGKTTYRDEGNNQVTASFAGHVESGVDWIFLRDDAVAVFDAHITFHVDKPEHCFEGLASGQVDISSLAAPWTAIATREELERLSGTLRVKLPISFQTARPRPSGSSQRLSSALKKAAANAHAFVELGKGQFVAEGSIVIQKGVVTSVDLDVKAI